MKMKAVSSDWRARLLPAKAAEALGDCAWVVCSGGVPTVPAQGSQREYVPGILGIPSGEVLQILTLTQNSRRAVS